MKSLNSIAPAFALAVLISASCVSTEARGVTVSRKLITNPTGICQSSLPVFDGVIRKRPLAVQNEGDALSFVTCSFTSQGIFSSVDVYFSSNDNAAHSIECTGVSGYQSSQLNEYVVKQVDVPASGAQKLITWQGSDFANSPTDLPSARFSILCKLPPGAGINDSELKYTQDVGM